MNFLRFVIGLLAAVAGGALVIAIGAFGDVGPSPLSSSHAVIFSLWGVTILICGIEQMRSAFRDEFGSRR